MIKPAWFAVFTALLIQPAGADDALQPATSVAPIQVGEAHTLETHDAPRRVNVLFPQGYDESDATYPLVLLLDGGTKQDIFLGFGIERWNQLWGRSEPAILVGIETVDRQRELLPPTRDEAEVERYPAAGEAEQFRAWIAESVLPLLRRSYRHDGRAFLIGESAAGHFVVQTWIEAPELFEGYAALSPSMQWNLQSLSRDFVVLPHRPRPPLFVSLADEGGATQEGTLRLVDAAGPAICFADRRATHVRHANTLHQLLPEALQFVLPTRADWLSEYGMAVDCRKGEAGPVPPDSAYPDRRD